MRRKVVSPGALPAPPERAPQNDLPSDVLVVMSKVKGYIKAHSDLRTSDGVSDPLSDHIRELCEKAARSARATGRGTVLARDFEAALRNEIAEE